MGACLSSGKADLATDLYNRIDNPDGYAMLIGLRSMCAKGDFVSASEVIAKQLVGNAAMSGKQIMESFQTLIGAALEMEDYSTARQTFVSTHEPACRSSYGFICRQVTDF